jgi:hypothetical protein
VLFGRRASFALPEWRIGEGAEGGANDAMRRLRLLLVVVSSLQSAAFAASPTYVSPDPATGRSLAVVVPDQPLLHTAQVFGVTPEAALAALDRAVGEGGRVVKLNAYLRDAALESAMHAAIAKHYPADALPALMCVVGTLADPAASVGLDAVATTTRSGRGVLPAGGAACISRARPGEGRICVK